MRFKLIVVGVAKVDAAWVLERVVDGSGLTVLCISLIMQLTLSSAVEFVYQEALV
jgi:hypothetical protein